MKINNARFAPVLVSILFAFLSPHSLASEPHSAPSVVTDAWEPVPGEKLSFRREIWGMQGQAILTVKVVSKMLHYTAETTCAADHRKVTYTWKRSDAYTNMVVDCWDMEGAHKVSTWLRFFEPLPTELEPYTRVSRNVVQRKK